MDLGLSIWKISKNDAMLSNLAPNIVVGDGARTKL